MSVLDLLKGDENLPIVDSALSSAGALFSLAPLAGLALYHQQANPNLSVASAIGNPIPGMSRYSTFGKAIGAEAKNQQQLAEVQRAKNINRAKKNLEKSLLKSDAIERISGNIREKNELIQSFALLLDDPNLGLPENDVMLLKQRLVSASTDSNADIQSLVSDIVDPIVNSNNDNAILKLNQLRSSYHGVGQLLAPSAKPISPYGVSYNPVDVKSLSNVRKRYVSELSELLGSGYQLRVGSINVRGNEQLVAQVFSTTGGTQKWRANIPLSKSELYFAGEFFQTAKAIPQLYIDASATISQIGKATSLKDIKHQTPFQYMLNVIREQKMATGRIDWMETRNIFDQSMVGLRRTLLDDSALGDHLLDQGLSQGRRIFIHGLEKLPMDRQIAYQQAFSGLRGVDLPAGGAKHMLSRSEMGMTGVSGVLKYSVFGQLQKSFGVSVGGKQQLTRDVARISARESQIAHREKMFIEDVTSIGRGRNVSIGSVDRIVNSAYSPYHGTTRGGVVRPIVLDFRKNSRLTQDVLDQGYAYTATPFTYREPITPTVLDPAQNKILQSELYARALEAGESGTEFGGRELLGVNVAGEQIFTPWTPTTKRGRIRIVQSSPIRVAGGATKHTTFLAGEIEKTVDEMKLFGGEFKGQVQRVDYRTLREHAEIDDILLAQLETYGIDPRRAIYTTPDMLSKGGMGHIMSMTSSAILAGKNLSIPGIRSHVEKIAQAYAGGTLMDDLFKDLGDDYRLVGQYARGVTELLVKDNADPYHIGNTLTGLYHSKEFDTIRSSLENLANVYFKDSSAQTSFLAGLRSGRMIALFEASGGEGREDWNRARASLEPRVGMALMERFQSMGLSTDESARLVASIYKNKVGLAQNMTVVSELLGFQSSVTGQYSPLRYLDDATSGVNRYSYNDFIKALSLNNGSILDLMKQDEKGFVLDLASGSDKIARAAKRAFGGTELRIPGARLLEAAKGTQIKVSGGGTPISIDSEIGQLFKSLQGILTEDQGDVKQLTESLKRFREKSSELFSRSAVGTLSGKVRGSASPIARHISLGESSLWNTEGNISKLQRARKLVARSQGRTAFLDTDAFLSQMLDLEGELSLNRRSKLMRMFFTAMELDDDMFSNMLKGEKGPGGILMALGRHPMISSGNMFMGDVYRDPMQVTQLGGQDELFNRFKSSTIGKKILKKHFGGPRTVGNIKSFADIARMGDAPTTRAFFDDFTKNLSQFYNFQSSGSILIPTLFGEGRSTVDFGQGAQALLDQDGDHVIAFHFDEHEATQISNALRNNKDFAKNDFLFRKYIQVMGQQSKAGMSAVAERMKNVKGMGTLAEDIVKEIGLSVKVGPLDVALRPLHQAIFNTLGNEDAMFSRSLLGVIQEQWLIKSKKLKVATNYPDAFRGGVNKLMQTGDVSDLAFVMGQMFEGTEFATEAGVKIDLSDLKKYGPEFDDLVAAGGERRFSLNSILSDWQKAAQNALARGSGHKDTADALSRMWAESPEAALNLMQLGADAQSAALKAFTGEANSLAQASFAGSQVKSSLSRLDKMFTGKVALGLTAGAFITGMLGKDYSAEPIIMPGEGRPSERISKDIAEGNLFGGSSPIDMGGADYPSAKMDHSSNNVTYLDRPNAYQLRGQVGQKTNIYQLLNQFNMLTGKQSSGSVVINDTRLPITSSYMDRLLGEY